MSHRNAKQMIRTLVQLASHIYSPMVNAYIVILFTPLQFEGIVMVAVISVEKEDILSVHLGLLISIYTH